MDVILLVESKILSVTEKI